MRERGGKSISGQVGAFTRVLTVLLALPAILSVVMMLVYAAWYQTSVSRMETAAALKPMVATQIPETVWYAVSGRTSFEECGVYDLIDEVDGVMDGLIAGEESLELTIARRTMETLTRYVRRIEENMAGQAPIVESEAVLEEVRDVAALVESMLEDYISSQITASSSQNARMTALVVLSAALEALLLAAAAVIAFTRARRRLERLIREPIGRLEHFAGMMAAGNLQARVPATDVLELENLTEGINNMADRLESLIEQSRREQENLRKSELRTLQAQINPHFLYNTLDTIIWQAEAGHSDEVIDITRALSDFFRISLSSGADWITVSQEIRHIVGYLSIQKIRYRDILTYEIDVEDGIGEVRILKLLLQPLVENALYHGIKYKRGGGRITVSGRREGAFLCFTVEDTGRGMTPERLEEVRERLRADVAPSAVMVSEGSHGFGLSNVDQRIRLYYDQPDGLRIDSDSSGTRVSFRVPALEREEQIHDQGGIGG